MKVKDILISYGRDRKLLDEIFQTSLVRLREICLGYNDSVAYRGFLSSLFPCQLVLRESDYANIFNNTSHENTQFKNVQESVFSIFEKDGYEFHCFSHIHSLYGIRVIVKVFDKVTKKTINFRDRSDYKEYETFKLFIKSCVK